MKALLKTFASGQGDCIFLILDNGERKYNLMVDCGQFNQPIKDFVAQTLSKHIDLLIVTHIDCDHVDGVTEMLKKIPDLTIGKIFYNCYQTVDGQSIMSMSEQVHSDIEMLRSNLPSTVIATDVGKVSMETASVLSAQIMGNVVWNNVWTKEYIHNGTQDYPLGNNFGRLVFLAPTLDKIKALDDDFAREYLRLTKHKLMDTPFPGQESLFELVTKIVAMKKKERDMKRKQKISIITDKYTDDRWNSAKNSELEPVTSSNAASIAFFWECNNKHVLFMGDADPAIVTKSLQDKKVTHIEFDAIKIAHHGSKHSTSNELMSIVDSNDYYFTGGNKTDKPSLETLAKIVMRGDEKVRTIHYNNKRNLMMSDFEKPELCDIKSKYHFQITDNNEQEFEY